MRTALTFLIFKKNTLTTASFCLQLTFWLLRTFDTFGFIHYVDVEKFVDLPAGIHSSLSDSFRSMASSEGCVSNGLSMISGCIARCWTVQSHFAAPSATAWPQFHEILHPSQTSRSQWIRAKRTDSAVANDCVVEVFSHNALTEETCCAGTRKAPQPWDSKTHMDVCRYAHSEAFYFEGNSVRHYQQHKPPGDTQRWWCCVNDSFLYLLKFQLTSSWILWIK